jgi:hypothetical protein
LHFGEKKMLKKIEEHPKFENFLLPFDGKLNGSNRWVKLAGMIPWEELEKIYGSKMSKTMGRPGLTARIAIGSLLIKHKLNLSDEETVEQISENPYLQYFLGYEEFKQELPFDPSMLSHFRKRLNFSEATEVNELLTKLMSSQKKSKEEESDDDDSDDENGEKKSGKLLIDATVAPADMKYPTDLELLNEAREKSEKLIDTLHDPKDKKKKPRTYRQKARKEYLSVAKRKNRSAKFVRKALKKQVGYLKRNIKHIDKFLEGGKILCPKNIELLRILKKVLFQQSEMLNSGRKSVEDRIVSISQPHVRPIVRGKAGAKTEFGAKISVSVVDGMTYVDRISWDAYNESQDLISQVESYKKRFGFYPESVHADRIYATRDNRRFLSEKGIRLSAPPLGRPRENISDAEKKQRRQDEIDRIPVEGKFGNGKRKYSLDRIYAKLKSTSETWIMLIIIVMNLDKCLAKLFGRLFYIFLYFIKALKTIKCQASGDGWIYQ